MRAVFRPGASKREDCRKLSPVYWPGCSFPELTPRSDARRTRRRATQGDSGKRISTCATQGTTWGNPGNRHMTYATDRSRTPPQSQHRDHSRYPRRPVYRPGVSKTQGCLRRSPVYRPGCSKRGDSRRRPRAATHDAAYPGRLRETTENDARRTQHRGRPRETPDFDV